jgi:trk system potassium uptake protein TrkA
MGEYIVLGLGVFGRSLALEMQALGNEVIGVDASRSIVQSLSGEIRQVIEADATSEATLRDLGVSNLDGAVVAIRDPEPSIMTTLLLKKMGVRHVVARATSALHEEILKLAGANRVVFPEREMAVRLAHEVAVPDVVDYLSISTDMGINKLLVPKSLIGKTYREADLENRFRIRIMATIRRDRVVFGTSLTDEFEANDVLIVSGRDDDLRKLATLTEREPGG